MKNNIWTIMRKEFARFFRDKGMVFLSLILPGLMIYAIYSFMGTAIANANKEGQNVSASAYTINLPPEMKAPLEQLGIHPEAKHAEQKDTLREQIKAKKAQLLIVFPEGFMKKIMAIQEERMKSSPAQPGVSAGTKQATQPDYPNVEIYYNAIDKDSDAVFQRAKGFFNAYQTSMNKLFDVNLTPKGGEDPYNMASQNDMSGKALSMMLPMLLLIFLFSAGMGISTESIAGEKERGTIATLLVTPLRRRDLAIGKILSLSAIALLSGLSSFIGMALSLPKMLGSEGSKLSISSYGPGDYFAIILLIFATALLIVAILALISALCRTVKQASTAAMPLMVLVMLLGITSIFGNAAPENPLIFLIPLYNTVQAVSGVLQFQLQPAFLAITAVSNILYAFVLGIVLAKVFDSERILYN